MHADPDPAARQQLLPVRAAIKGTISQAAGGSGSAGPSRRPAVMAAAGASGAGSPNGHASIPEETLHLIPSAFKNGVPVSALVRDTGQSAWSEGLAADAGSPTSVVSGLSYSSSGKR